MATTIKGGVSSTYCGLDTYNHTAATTGIYTIEVRMTENPPSGVSILIKQGSSTVATAVTPRSQQTNVTVRAVINATQGDVLSVITSSSSAIDQQLNNLKTEINLRQGS